MALVMTYALTSGGERPEPMKGLSRRWSYLSIINLGYYNAHSLNQVKTGFLRVMALAFSHCKTLVKNAGAGMPHSAE